MKEPDRVKETYQMLMMAGICLACITVAHIYTSCSQLPTKVGAAVADQVVHETRSYAEHDRRLVALEKSDDHNRTEIEQLFGSVNHSIKRVDRQIDDLKRQVAEMKGAMSRKQDRILQNEEEMLRLLRILKKEKRITKR